MESMSTTTGMDSHYVPVYEDANRTLGRYYGVDRGNAWVLRLLLTWITPRYIEDNVRHAVPAIPKSHRILRRIRPRSR